MRAASEENNPSSNSHSHSAETPPQNPIPEMPFVQAVILNNGEKILDINVFFFFGFIFNFF